MDGTKRRADADLSHAGWRLDRFLASVLGDFSRSRLQQLLEQGAVSLPAQDGQDRQTIRDANHRVKPGDAYDIAIPAAAPARPRGQDIPLSVVYEDKDLIVIEKPPGWWCIRRRAIRTARW